MGSTNVLAARSAARASGAGALDVARDVAGRLHRTLNLAVIAGVPLQFYLAGTVLFGATSITPHRVAGFLLLACGMASLVLALIAGRSRATPGLAAIVFLLLLLQPILATLLRPLPAIAALHAVNGLAILGVALLGERHRSSLLRPGRERM